MDTSAKDIDFDAQGVCNYCTDFFARLERSGGANGGGASNRERLNDLVEQIRTGGTGLHYDCVVGVSGGVDSSWTLVQAVRHGLRPLAVHMDNGWNSELAQNNIANLVRALDVDLHTHVINWQEYRRLMQAFFDADVIDIELLYDNAMLAVNYQQAAQQGVKYILAGTNEATEGMPLPRGWNWHKFDKRNIKALARSFGRVRMKTFPSIGTLGLAAHKFVRGIRWISFLDYMEYNRQDVLDALRREYAYKPYPYKHYESVFTRFYQGYILPTKFGVDKRRVHLSTLVVSGQMTRDEALQGTAGLAYPSAADLEADRQYFLKKMGWRVEDLTAYLERPGRAHDEYPSERRLWELLGKVRRRLGTAAGRG
jgi:N-acetyl sugar amidotransferase